VVLQVRGDSNAGRDGLDDAERKAMSKRAKAAAESKPINSSNYRTTAQKMIEKYESMGLIVDALLWSHVIGLYEAALNLAGVPPEPESSEKA
jgi:hypothetical protein